MPHEPIGTSEDSNDVRYWTWGRDDREHEHGGLGDLPDRDYGAFREHRPPYLGPSRDARIMRGVPQQRLRDDRVSVVKVERADERILEDVCDVLTHEGWVDATHIDVSVEDQHVTLAGDVEEREQKWLAEECAERVLGVRAVINRIRVRSASDRVAGEPRGETRPGGDGNGRRAGER